MKKTKKLSKYCQFITKIRQKGQTFKDSNSKYSLNKIHINKPEGIMTQNIIKSSLEKNLKTQKQMFEIPTNSVKEISSKERLKTLDQISKLEFADSSKNKSINIQYVSELHFENTQQKIKKLKHLRKNIMREEKKKILLKYPLLNRFSKCNSKVGLIRIFHNLSEKWKRLIKMYMERCFITHLHIRQMKDFSELMSQRQNIYEALDYPELLISKINFGNNLVKNFCKGLTNFVVMFLDELIKEGFIKRSRLIKVDNKFNKG